MENNTEELKQDELSQVAGGGPVTGFPDAPYKQQSICTHTRRVKTGKEREDRRWLICTQHQFEYQCIDCKKTFWVDEEP